MLATLCIVLTYSFSFFRRRHDLALEVLALRHQLMVLERQTRRPRLRRSDRYLWLLLMRVWPNWRNGLIFLQPETLIGWHRAGFRLFWRWKSRHRLGRPEKSQEVVQLIRRMWIANWSKRHGHPAEVDGPEIALAKSICRAFDRFHSTRMPGSSHRFERTVVEKDSERLLRILPSGTSAPFTLSRQSDPTATRVARSWESH